MKCVGNGLEGNPGTSVVASTSQYRAALRDGPAQKLVGQFRFADAKLTLEENDSSFLPFEPPTTRR